MEVSTSPPASSAGTVEANRTRRVPVGPPATVETYSGLMPSRSRAITVRPVSRSVITQANMPSRRSTHDVPHCGVAACMTTSVSQVEKNRWPRPSSSARSSR